jgi:hypothetical protein
MRPSVGMNITKATVYIGARGDRGTAARGGGRRQRAGQLLRQRAAGGFIWRARGGRGVAARVL